MRLGIICLLVLAASVSAADVPYGIVDAARRGDENAARKLLEEEPSLALETDDWGYTPLDWACTRGYWHIVGHLLAAEAPVNSVGGDGGTCLHKACHHGRADMIAKLIDAGADIHIANRWGRVPLHVAVRRGHVGVAKLLLDRGADIGAVTKEGWTPLHVAQKAGQPAMVELLLARGADPDREDAEGRKPADMAMTRPPHVDLDSAELDQYQGNYDLGHGYGFKIWRGKDGLRIQEFAPDDLYPIGEDEFYCVQEPWRVKFNRDAGGVIESVDVDFLRRTVRGTLVEQAHYVGSRACLECHLDREHPEGITWASSRHAAAYWRLATDWASMIASFRPHFKDMTDPISDDRCLLCHTTAAQDPDALVEASFRVEEGIGCETCHGPGSRYRDVEVMTDHEAFIANGGITPDEQACRNCHRNPERFDFAEWWPKIAHGRQGEG